VSGTCPAALVAALAAVLILTPGHSKATAQHLQTSLPEDSHKLPRPQPLGRDVVYLRDPATGEIRSAPDEPAGNPVTGAIHSRVTLVQVACTVTAHDGTQVRGLTQRDFRLFEDGVEQKIASFDAAATPALIALVIDASPSIYRELGQMREAARSLAASLSPVDQIAVVSFSAQAHLLLPFSRDRKLLDRALDSGNLARVENSSQSNIYQSVFLTARELFSGRTSRKAIVLLTDGQDSSLGLTWDPASASPGPDSGARRLSFDDVARELGADSIDLFVVSTEMRPRAMTPEWLEAHRREMLVTKNARRLEIPNYTLYLAELARPVGGSLYFLREVGNLSDIYRRIALTISAQYTLGYYPAAGTSRSGWRSLKVELAEGANAPPGSRVTHRAAYYLSAFP
jgi:VWFA-related protein